MKDTIIIINDAAHITGGAGKVALQSAIGLAKQGYKVILFAGQGPISPDLIENGIEVICLDQKDILSDDNRSRAIVQGLWNKTAKKKLEELLQSLDISKTIVHAHSWTKTLSASIFDATAKYNVRVVITLHDYFMTCPNGGLFNYIKQEKCTLKPLSTKCICTNCDSRSYSHKLWRSIRQVIQNRAIWAHNNVQLISISDLNEKLIKTTLKKDVIIHRVANPIDMNPNPSLSISEHTDADKPYLYVGRLSIEKGFQLFCQALTELKLKGIVVGDGADFESYKNKYTNLDFVGWKKESEIPEYFEKAKALIFPSLVHEASPLTTKEAKSYGLPCIVPNPCAAVEDVEDGVTGFLFESGNIDSLKEAIMKFENSAQQQFRKSTLDRFQREKYEMHSHIEALSDIYKQFS